MERGPQLLIAGGYGVFGQLLTRELLGSTQARLQVAGRDGARAAEFCASLSAPERVTPLALDLRDPAALAAAASGCFAVLCAAGPFQALPGELPARAVGAGAHWLDLADTQEWVLPALEDAGLDEAARTADRAVLPGVSTVPTLSGALVRRATSELPGATRARITLFIGNRNAKGVGAISSSLAASDFDQEEVAMPFGKVAASRYASPDAAILSADLGLAAEFRVAVESSLGRRLMGAFAVLNRKLSPQGKARLARLLAWLAAPTSRFGTGGGCLQVELWDERGRSVAASLSGPGQRMAILPCALAAEALLRGELAARGLVRPATWLPSDEWIARLTARGLEFQCARTTAAAS